MRFDVVTVQTYKIGYERQLTALQVFSLDHLCLCQSSLIVVSIYSVLLEKWKKSSNCDEIGNSAEVRLIMKNALWLTTDGSSDICFSPTDAHKWGFCSGRVFLCCLSHTTVLSPHRTVAPGGISRPQSHDENERRCLKCNMCKRSNKATWLSPVLKAPAKAQRLTKTKEQWITHRICWSWDWGWCKTSTSSIFFTPTHVFGPGWWNCPSLVWCNNYTQGCHNSIMSQQPGVKRLNEH